MDRPRLRLASYNIRKCIGLDRRRRPERVLSVINALHADVVALQEADRRLGDRPAALPRPLIAAETDFDVLDVAVSEASLGWHGNAVLVRRGVAARLLDRLTLRGAEPRGAVLAEVAGIVVAAVHLGLLRRNRRRQLAEIAAALPTDRPAAILGDFNEWSAVRGLEALHGFEVHTPGRSFHAARPLAALDRIALGPGLALERAGVLEAAPARIASDHLPVWADIAAADRAGRLIRTRPSATSASAPISDGPTSSPSSAQPKATPKTGERKLNDATPEAG